MNEDKLKRPRLEIIKENNPYYEDGGQMPKNIFRLHIITNPGFRYEFLMHTDDDSLTLPEGIIQKFSLVQEVTKTTWEKAGDSNIVLPHDNGEE